MTEAEFRRIILEELRLVQQKLDTIIERVGDHESRLVAVERWIRERVKRGERAEDAGQHRRNRVATLFGGGLGGVLGVLGGWLAGHH